MGGKKGCLIGLIIPSLISCGPGNGLNLGRVHGKVTYHGVPLQLGNVIFLPDSSRGTDGPVASCSIRSDGTYELTTSDAADGALVGFHKVGIIGLDPNPVKVETPKVVDTDEDPEDETSGKPTVGESVKAMLDGKRQFARKSRRAIPKGQPTLRLNDSKTYRFLTPEKLSSPIRSGVEVEVNRGTNEINFLVEKDGTVSIQE